MLDFWYQDAIFYELDVKTFQDGNGDGIGDFQGLTSRLAYISGLGATCLWLQPFHPSPLRDDGYDVTDYYAIDPRLGTFGDFVVFLREAEEHGLRVISDLVVNHTSDEHPWFRSARQGPDAPFHDYYLWSKTRPHDELPVIFPGYQKGTWSYDRQAGLYYHHRFYEFQPDLNTANLAVREEIGKIMSFWLRLGLSGFRLDAAPFLVEHLDPTRPAEVTAFVHLEESEADRPFALLREMRRALSWCRGDAIFVAEANVEADHAAHFFGPEGDRMHLLFNFLVNQQMMLALARQEAAPLAEMLRRMPELPPGGQWLNFLRMHDELDLGRLSKEEREEVYAQFAPEESMRLYDRGIRRRLSPMLEGDQRRVELAFSLLLSLPGTPMIRYGEEIGMGDDLSLPERLSVRTPMQWCSGSGAGFSTAPAKHLIRPLIEHGKFGVDAINVSAQQGDTDSLLSRLERLIRIRKGCPKLAHSQLKVLESGEAAVMAHRCEATESAVVFLHNLSSREVQVPLKVVQSKGEKLRDLLGPQCAHGEKPEQPLKLAPYGYRWLRVVGGKWEER